MTELPLNQKEYLKKYLAIGKAPGEKKKKKKKHISTRVQIIDDDVDMTITNSTLDDPIVIDEDAPQIVAIIDERPPSLRFDEKTKNPLWQPIGPVENAPGEQKQMIKGFKIEPKANDKPLLRPDKSPPRRKKRKGEDYSLPRKSRREESPVRDIVIKEERQSVSRSVENSPRNDVNDISLHGTSISVDDSNSPRRIKIEDPSPPRRIRDDDNSPPRRNSTCDDNSPPRRNDDNSPPRKNRTHDDNSPPRRNKMRDDNSPPRRNRTDDDYSPPRRNRPHGDNSSPRRNKTSTDRNRSQSKIDNISSPRKRRTEEDSSTSRKRRDDSPRRSRVNDFSSPRRRKYDSSPPRRSRRSETPPRRRDDRNARNRTPDRSPPKKNKREEKRTEGGNKNDETRSKKMEKTLDGKAAGLQNATDLNEETRNFRLREDKLFKALPKDVSGEIAATVHRDRKSGKVRNLEQEEEYQRKKREEEEKNKEKYERWGRGLAQVENREQQLKEQLHEMSKPLARYADDEDLEKYLKEQEREGDPMLAYIRKKKRKKAADAGEATKPLFEGEFMPNRYGIRPGHRWDGVDRSNGYEKKWFEVQNEKKAQQEDTYKWSTEDM